MSSLRVGALYKPLHTKPWLGGRTRLFPGKACWLDLTRSMSSLGKSRGHLPNPLCQHSGSYLNLVWVLVAVWVGYLSVSGAFLRGLKPQLLGSPYKLVGGFLHQGSGSQFCLHAFFFNKSTSQSPRQLYHLTGDQGQEHFLS